MSGTRGGAGRVVALGVLLAMSVLLLGASKADAGKYAVAQCGWYVGADAGWGDTTITPENTVLYYESVLGKMGKNQGDFTRLFLVPGMGHCRGGDGPHTFDTIGALEQWREKGVTPTQLTGFNPASSLSRPICSYPQYAKYKGSGNVKDAANWSCAN